jgi:hypothetical protein
MWVIGEERRTSRATTRRNNSVVAFVIITHVAVTLAPHIHSGGGG